MEGTEVLSSFCKSPRELKYCREECILPAEGREANGKLNATWASSCPADVFEFGGLGWPFGLAYVTAAGFVKRQGVGFL